jgi:two-component system chemotaxis response regulator CheB
MTVQTRILVVDDSPAMQQLLRIVIEAEPDLRLIGVAGSAEEGWGLFAADAPDIVLLDLELPGRPGLDLLKRIIRERPAPVIIVSANGGTGSTETISALAAGAVAFIDKPDTVNISLDSFRATLIATIRESASASSGLKRIGARIGTTLPAPGAQAEFGRDRIVAIGASTGGVPAVQTVLSGLAKLPVAIVVTQHMPAGYTQRFAERIAQVTGFDAREARDGDALGPGKVLIAPGDRHLVVTPAPGGGLAARLDPGPPVSGHKPSVDVMFRSVAEVAGKRAVGVLLTGMGRDGADGLLALRQAGAVTAAESEQTCVVFGMPKAAIENGGAAETLALPMIPGWITRQLTGAKPAEPVKGATERTPEKGLQKDLRNKPIAAFRVLVVDDQKSMRGLAQISLNKLGFARIDEAESGEEALKRMQEMEYDLMLLDWNMDGMSGIDVLRTARKEKNERELCIVMATSENYIGKVHEATQAGANNYMVKPYEPVKLKQRLERALMRNLPNVQ